MNPRTVRDFQEHLLKRRKSAATPLSDRVREAFLNCPRHLFVERYREAGSGRWIVIDDKNLESSLGDIYRDAPLAVWGDPDSPAAERGSAASTISQPSFVLLILDLLDIQPGDTVFELGTGSGWNAALMGHLARPGRVFSSEIIEPLAQQARERLSRLGVENVTVISGSGTRLPADARFDKAIFTAGAEDLPGIYYQAIRPGGRLIFVLAGPAGCDLLIVFERDGEGFCSSEIIECGFVPVTGQPEWSRFRARSVAELEFPVVPGQRRVDEDAALALARLEPALEFLSLHDAFVPLSPSGGLFAWRGADSLLVAYPGEWIEYGAAAAARDLAAALKRWEVWGRPRRRDLSVTALPVGLARPDPDGVLMTRLASAFVWRQKTTPPRKTFTR